MTSIRLLPKTIPRISLTTTRSRFFLPSRPLTRFSSSTTSQITPPDYLDERERGIFEKLQSTFQPISLEVQDVSGGCGSMYAVEISSEKFKGLTLLKQHRLVKDALGEDVKKWHGFQLRTKTPE